MPRLPTAIRQPPVVADMTAAFLDGVSNTRWLARVQPRSNNEDERASLVLAATLNAQEHGIGVFEDGLLLLGSELHAASATLAREYYIRHIVNAAGSDSGHFLDDGPLEDDEVPFDIEYHDVDVSDEETSTLPLFEQVTLIESCVRRTDATLVHCVEGRSRSAALVIAYVMRRHDWDYDTALAFVRQQRAIVQPNPGFVQQLRALRRLDIEEVDRYLTTHATQVPDTFEWQGTSPNILLTDVRSEEIAKKRVGDTITSTELGVSMISASTAIVADLVFYEDYTCIAIHPPFPPATDKQHITDDNVRFFLRDNAIYQRWIWNRGVQLVIDRITTPYGNRKFACHLVVAPQLPMTSSEER